MSPPVSREAIASTMSCAPVIVVTRERYIVTQRGNLLIKMGRMTERCIDDQRDLSSLDVVDDV